MRHTRPEITTANTATSPVRVGVTRRVGNFLRNTRERLSRPLTAAGLAGAIAITGALVHTQQAEAKPVPPQATTNLDLTPSTSEWQFAHNFQPETQQAPDWCLDASGQMSLQTVIGRRVSQLALVNIMGTTSGTFPDEASAALNIYTFKKGLLYDYRPVKNTTQLRADLAYDIDELGVAPIGGVNVSRLPYDKGLWGNHAITVYGYDALRGMVAVDDPETPALHGGEHYMTAGAFFNALESGPGGDRYLIMISSVTHPEKN